MGRPLLLAVEDDPEHFRLVEQELAKRYGRDYRVVCVSTAPEARAILDDAVATGGEVALLVVNLSLPGDAALDLFAEVRARQLGAKSVALNSWKRPVNRGLAQDQLYRAAGAGLIDDWIAVPWQSGDEHFHQGISNFLYQWWEARNPSFGRIQIVGERWSARAHAIRDLLTRHNVRFAFVDIASQEGRLLVDQFHLDDSKLPAVIAFSASLENPSNLQIAEAFGLRTRPSASRYDVTVIGGGPAGLSAAVYGASEGLRTLILERESVGGQAGSSSAIRNYLGFARGITGADLANRAFEQARMFGADYVYSEALRLDDIGHEFVITLADRGTVTSRALIIATGAAYRRLGIEAVEAFTGSGVFYGATAAETQAMKDQEVHVVGGANSAGQAALHLAGHASHVTLIVRGAALAATMSDYLIRAIEAAPNITVRCTTEVVDGSGDRQLRQLSLRDKASGTTETVATGGLFVMIGAEPYTSWLPPAIRRDPWGYVLTGSDLLQTSEARPAWTESRPPLPFETSMPGVFAVGDVRHGSSKRVAAAVGDGSVAVRLLHEYLAQLSEQERIPDIGPG